MPRSCFDVKILYIHQVGRHQSAVEQHREEYEKVIALRYGSFLIESGYANRADIARFAAVPTMVTKW